MQNFNYKFPIKLRFRQRGGTPWKRKGKNHISIKDFRKNAFEADFHQILYLHSKVIVDIAVNCLPSNLNLF